MWPNFSIPDAEALQREAEAIKIDELNVAQIKELRDKVIYDVVSSFFFALSITRYCQKSIS